MAYKYPNDPATRPNQSTQEPRSLVIPNEKPGQAQSVGLAVASIPSRLIGGDGIRVEAKGFAYAVSLDIEELSVAQGQPNQQWLAVWIEGSGSDEIRRVPVNAIPADANHDNIVYGRQNGAWVPAISSVTIDWDDVTNKPTTFPPTLPIPSSGVTDLDVHQAAQDAAIGTLEFDMSAVEAVNTAQDGRLSAIEAKNLAQDADIDAVEAGLGNTWTKAQADARYVDVTGDTMSGDLAIAKPSPTMVLGKIVGTPARFIGANGGVARWTMTVGDGAAEPGSNAGSDFAITRHDDAGVVIDNPVTMLRSTGVWNFTKTPTVNGAPLIGGATISDTPPVAPVPGQFWWESDSGGLFLRYADANSSQWVQVNSPSLPDAVSDGKSYGRFNGTWTAVLPIAGGTITGALQVNGAVNLQSTLTVAGIVTGSSLFSTPAGSVNAGTAGIVTNGQIAFVTPTNYVVGYAGAANVTCGQSVWQIMYGGSATYQFTTGLSGQSGFLPLQDNQRYMGAGSFRWTALYAVSGSINTSDEKEKQDIRPLEEAELRVARALKPLICAYRWKDAVEQKGDDARIHVGIIAQRVQEAFEAEGLDAHRYGMFCADEIEEYVHAVVEEDENGVAQTVEEGHMRKTGEIRYGVRYEELLAFIIGGL